MARAAIAARFAAVVLLSASLGLSACSSSSEPTEADAIQQYDPAEVQMLRDQAAQANIELNDALLLSTLESRDDCRVLQAALRDLAAGKNDGDAMQALADLPRSLRERSQTEQANYFQGAVDKAQLGDPTTVQGYVDANCTDVQ